MANKPFKNGLVYFYVEVRELPNALFQNHLFCAREIRAPDRDERPDASNLLS